MAIEQKTTIWCGNAEDIIKQAVEKNKNVIYVGCQAVYWDEYIGRRGPVLKNNYGFEVADRENMKRRIEEGTLLAAMHVGYITCSTREEYELVEQRDEGEVISIIQSIAYWYENNDIPYETCIIVDVGKWGGFNRADELQKALVGTSDKVEMILLTDDKGTYSDKRWWSRGPEYTRKVGE